MDFRAALTANWPLKVTSLFLAVLLWIVAAAEEPSSLVAQVALLVQPPPGRTIERAPSNVSVLFVGSGRELLRLSATPLTLTRILPDTLTAHDVTLELAPADIALPRGLKVQVQDVQPRHVTVVLDSLYQRIVPVRAAVRVHAESGFALVGPITVVPATVRVTGPESLVRGIGEVSTIPVEFTRAQGPLDQQIAIDTASLGGLRIFPAEVSIQVDLEREATREFPAVPVRLSAAAARIASLERDSVAVLVHGPSARISALSPESLLVVVDGSGDEQAGRRAALRVLAPAGVTAHAQPDSLRLLRRP